MSIKIVKAEEKLKEHAEQMKIAKHEVQLKKLEDKLEKQSIEIMGVRGRVQLMNEHVDNNIMKEVQLYLEDEEKRIGHFLKKGRLLEGD